MTARTPMLAIQTAIFALLANDGSLGADVYDYVPENAAYPYVVIGEAYEQPDNVHGEFGRHTLVTLHVWTRSRGHADGLTMANRIVELLDHESLTIVDFRHIATRFEFQQVLRDPDPEIRHAVVRLRVVTEQEEGS